MRIEEDGTWVFKNELWYRSFKLNVALGLGILLALINLDKGILPAVVSLVLGFFGSYLIGSLFMPKKRVRFDAEETNADYE